MEPAPPPTQEKPVRLVLIEDHADFRESVSMVLEARGRNVWGRKMGNLEIFLPSIFLPNPTGFVE